MAAMDKANRRRGRATVVPASVGIASKSAFTTKFEAVHDAVGRAAAVPLACDAGSHDHVEHLLYPFERVVITG